MKTQLQTICVKATTTREDANAIIEKRNETVKQSVRQRLAELGMSQPVCDLRFGLWPVRSENPYDDVINIANYISNSLLDGWFFFFEAERLRRELAEIKGRRIEVIETESVQE